MQLSQAVPLYILRGHRFNSHRYIVFLSLKIDFVLANSVDDKMLHKMAFHLGLHCLSKYPFRGFWYTEG